jgi:hypothetical protein
MDLDSPLPCRTPSSRINHEEPLLCRQTLILILESPRNNDLLEPTSNHAFFHAGNPRSNPTIQRSGTASWTNSSTCGEPPAHIPSRCGREQTVHCHQLFPQLLQAGFAGQHNARQTNDRIDNKSTTGARPVQLWYTLHMLCVCVWGGACVCVGGGRVGAGVCVCVSASLRPCLCVWGWEACCMRLCMGACVHCVAATSTKV